MKFLFLIQVFAAFTSACRFPPDLWCSSEQIAKECKVYQQCKETVWTIQADAPLVSIELYYESLCPDCQNFIVDQLYPTYTRVAEIMNLTLVPYGNAREERIGDKWRFTCQHGEQECIGNVLETCAIHSIGSMNKIIPFLHCVETMLENSPNAERAVRSCATQQNVPLDPILSCYNSTLGNQLEHQMALMTDALNPPHKYVPWIVLNGVHTEDINDKATTNLLKLVCDTYTGTKPPACASDSFHPMCVKTI